MGKREPDKPTLSRTHYEQVQSGETLIQRLEAVAFTPGRGGHAGLGILDVTQRARAAFDVARVTGGSTRCSEASRPRFSDSSPVMARQPDIEWYASVMLTD